MSAQRINVSSGSEFEAQVGYSRAVRTGAHVVVAGTTGAGDDIAAQTREAFRRIAIALREAGASMSDVVRTRMYFTDISLWHEVGTVRRGVRRRRAGRNDGRGERAHFAGADGGNRGRRLYQRLIGAKVASAPRPVGRDTCRSSRGNGPYRCGNTGLVQSAAFGASR